MGLNRPDKYNAFDAKMLHQLAQAYTTYEQDDDLWCALLYTTSDNLTSGLDLGEVGPMVRRGEPLFPKDLIDPLRITGEGDDQTRSHRCAGVEFDRGDRIGARGGHLRSGRGDQVWTDRGQTRHYALWWGRHCACIEPWDGTMRCATSSPEISSQPREAHRIGLVQDLVEDPEELFEYALGIAERIASQAPLAVQASLASARKTLLEGEEAAKEDLMDQARRLMETEDAAEGLRSFLERRDAEFSGE